MISSSGKAQQIFADSEDMYNELCAIWLERAKSGNTIPLFDNQAYKIYYKAEHNKLVNDHGILAGKINEANKNLLKTVKAWQLYLQHAMAEENSLQYGYEPGFSREATEQVKTSYANFKSTLNKIS